MRRRAASRKHQALRCEPVNGFEQHRVVRCFLQLGLPNIARACALAFGPEHFAKMRGYLWIRPLGQRASEELFRLFELAEAIVAPAHAVQDEWILWCERVSLFDELHTLFRPLGAVDERVAER